MQIRDSFSAGEEPYNLVPLTDMVFILLIFFISATTFVQVEKEMGLKLPPARATAMNTATTSDPLIINIRQDGKTLVAGRAYDDAGLARLLSTTVAQGRNRVVIIRADERSIVQHFANVARICKQAGVSEARLVYLEGAGGN